MCAVCMFLVLRFGLWSLCTRGLATLAPEFRIQLLCAHATSMGGWGGGRGEIVPVPVPAGSVKRPELAPLRSDVDAVLANNKNVTRNTIHTLPGLKNTV